MESLPELCIGLIIRGIIYKRASGNSIRDRLPELRCRMRGLDLPLSSRVCKINNKKQKSNKKEKKLANFRAFL